MTISRRSSVVDIEVAGYRLLEDKTEERKSHHLSNDPFIQQNTKVRDIQRCIILLKSRIKRERYKINAIKSLVVLISLAGLASFATVYGRTESAYRDALDSFNFDVYSSNPATNTSTCGELWSCVYDYPCFPNSLIDVVGMGDLKTIRTGMMIQGDMNCTYALNDILQVIGKKPEITILGLILGMSGFSIGTVAILITIFCCSWGDCNSFTQIDEVNECARIHGINLTRCDSFEEQLRCFEAEEQKFSSLLTRSAFVSGMRAPENSSSPITLLGANAAMGETKLSSIIFFMAGIGTERQNQLGRLWLEEKKENKEDRTESRPDAKLQNRL